MITALLVAYGLSLTLTLSGCQPDQKKEHPNPTYNSSPVEYVETSAPIKQTGAVILQGGGAGLGVYSTGYRIGQITKLSVKGMMFKSGEGQMLMGRESVQKIIQYGCGDGDVCTKIINPWEFSMDEIDVPKLMPFVGEYAWMSYNQAQVKVPKYSTDYMVTSFDHIATTSPPTCVDSGAPSGSKSEGIRVGRIVKVSQRGHLIKTTEMKMQIGNAGSDFKDMSLSDSMYGCVVEVLKTAKKVKVHYMESWFRVPTSSDTSYSVLKIEPVKDI